MNSVTGHYLRRIMADYKLDKNPDIAAITLKEQGGTHAEIADTLLFLKQSGYKTRQLVELTGYKDYQVRHYYLLSRKLTKPVKDLLHENRIKYSLARAIASVDPEEQEEKARRALSHSTSVHRFRAEKNTSETYSSQKEKDEFEKLSINMSEQCGLMVTVEPAPIKQNTGRVYFDYTSLEDFDYICERLGVDPSQF